MDASRRSYSIKSQDEKIIFNDNSLQIINEHPNENISKEFARYFSIDDDDIVLLDQSQVIHYDVKTVLNNLINNILSRENYQSQIRTQLSKRSLDTNNEEEYLLNKKVRFNIPDDEEQQPSTCLFVSETLPITNQSKPYAQFLYNLGFDLCLEQNLNENTYLSESKKQTLIKHNKVFHQYPIYSCKYCSFQTNLIHVIDLHYRTPHTLKNSIYHNKKYRCTYCSFHTFHISELRRHLHRKHHYSLVSEPPLRRYPCSYCSYDTDERNHFIKHNKRCQIEQTQTRIANNLLAPYNSLNRNINTQISTIKTKPILKKNNNQTTTKKLSSCAIFSLETLNNNDIIEPILIESDHGSSSRSSSSSDKDFIISSDDESSSSSDNENVANRDLNIPTSSRPKTTQQLTSTTYSSLTKLLLLNGNPTSSFISSSLNSNKSSLIPIQPKPSMGTDIYRMCNICQCYIFKNDYIKHMNEKHNNLPSQSQQTTSAPIIILNNPTNNTNTSVTSLKPAVIVSKVTSQSPTTIFLLSTSTMDSQSITLNMIKCPWCDTNFAHIDVMTGHLMRYHRMTLAASKVVVAEQMKIQGTSSNQLSLMFKLEIEQIQREFIDKFYWKISQPKIYLHQIDNLSCFVCNINVEDIENHLLSSHQIQLTTMNTNKQCCLCGFHCDKKNTSLFEHQLRTHLGVCYSSILKQFIRFDPPPPPLSKTIVPKTNNRLISPPSSKRVLTTCTEKKFGCRKCDTSSGLFTFEELIEHLRLNHELNVKLHRRCVICQQTYLKGDEYNQHCLEHLNDEDPSVQIRRHYIT